MKLQKHVDPQPAPAFAIATGGTLSAATPGIAGAVHGPAGPALT